MAENERDDTSEAAGSSNSAVEDRTESNCKKHSILKKHPCHSYSRETKWTKAQFCGGFFHVPAANKYDRIRRCLVPDYTRNCLVDSTSCAVYVKDKEGAEPLTVAAAAVLYSSTGNLVYFATYDNCWLTQTKKKRAEQFMCEDKNLLKKMGLSEERMEVVLSKMMELSEGEDAESKKPGSTALKEAESKNSVSTDDQMDLLTARMSSLPMSEKGSEGDQKFTLVVYLTLQPCHYSVDHTPNKSCCERLVLFDKVLQNVTLVIKPSHIYKAHWNGNKDERTVREIKKANEGIELLLREGIDLQPMQENDWDLLKKELCPRAFDTYKGTNRERLDNCCRDFIDTKKAEIERDAQSSEKGTTEAEKQDAATGGQKGSKQEADKKTKETKTRAKTKAKTTAKNKK